MEKPRCELAFRDLCACAFSCDESVILSMCVPGEPCRKVFGKANECKNKSELPLKTDCRSVIEHEQSLSMNDALAEDTDVAVNQ